MRKKSWFSEQYKGHLILLVLFITGLVSATVYLLQKAGSSDRKILQLNFIALLLGLVFEYWRISQKATTVLWTALAAYLFSFLAFMKGKRERVYIFEDHLEMWPYYFLVLFLIIATFTQYAKATKRMTEGITLLLTIAINYWIVANDYWHSNYLIVKCLIVINLIFTLFSIFHSLSYRSLGKGSRLALSIWASIITLILSADNFLQIYQHRDIEHLPTFSASAFAFFQFFLLGISGIYIAQNLTMVAAYLPAKKYLENIREMNDIHLSRFSDQQVHVADSIIVITTSIAAFGLNCFFHFVPINFMIWATITVTPFLLYLVRRVMA